MKLTPDENHNITGFLNEYLSGQEELGDIQANSADAEMRIVAGHLKRVRKLLALELGKLNK